MSQSNPNKVIVSDFNNLLSPIDKPFWQKVNREILREMNSFRKPYKTHCLKQTTKEIPKGKGVKMFLFANDMILYIYPKDPPQKNLRADEHFQQRCKTQH